MRGRLMRVPRATQQPHTLFSCISARLRGCCRRAAILRGQHLSQWHSVSIANTAPSRAVVGRVSRGCEGVQSVKATVPSLGTHACRPAVTSCDLPTQLRTPAACVSHLQDKRESTLLPTLLSVHSSGGCPAALDSLSPLWLPCRQGSEGTERGQELQEAGVKPSGAHISCVCRLDHPDKDGVSTLTQSQVKCADRREYTQGRPSTQARPASIDWRQSAASSAAPAVSRAAIRRCEARHTG